MLGDEPFLTGGEKEGRSLQGEVLYITTRAFILANGDDGPPDVKFVHQK